MIVPGGYQLRVESTTADATGAPAEEAIVPVVVSDGDIQGVIVVTGPPKASPERVPQ